jgi:transposase
MDTRKEIERLMAQKVKEDFIEEAIRKDLACILRMDEGWEDDEIKQELKIRFDTWIEIEDYYNCVGHFKIL